MPDYSLYYWPIPFRGHFIRYGLAQAGATWDEPGFDDIARLKNAAPEDQPYPFMAPPLLVDHKEGVTLSQLPAILNYIARTCGIATTPDRDLRLICDASDLLLEITRCHGTLMWDAPSWSEFKGVRLPRWMRLHERIVSDGGVGNGYLGGKAPGLGDLILAALWHTMVDRLPPLRPMLHENAPRLEGLVDRVADTRAIAALLAEWTDRTPIYCGGQIETSLLSELGMEG